ncbi:hypothetical protein, partial [Janibacter anophelis]|uniref:hypothetical protein n=1 Tax=Janibacter anophelis TaxID=319054 RepID=UPI0013B053AD
MGDHDYRYDPATNVLSVDVNLHDGSWAQRAEVVTSLRNSGFTVTGEGFKMRSFVISALPEVFTLAGGDFAAHAAALARDQQSARDRERRLSDPGAARAALERYLDARARVHLRRVAPVGTPWDAAVAAVAAPGGTDPEALRRMAAFGQPGGGFSLEQQRVALGAWMKRVKATDGAQWQTDLPTLAFNPGQYLDLIYEPSWLPSLTRLARSQARPDERVLAATRDRLFEGRRHREVDLLVLTHGFAIRDRQASFRVDALVSFVPVDLTDPHGELVANVHLGGDFSIIAFQDSIMFDVLWLQWRLQGDVAAGAVSSASGGDWIAPGRVEGLISPG